MSHAHSHDHHHDHDHDHAPIEAEDTSSSDTAILADALRMVLIEKGIFTAAEVQDQLTLMEGRSDRNGAAMIARAWVDADYRDALLADGAAAAQALGYDTKGTPLIVLENTAKVHNVVVCTLCSCYPGHAAWPVAGMVQVQGVPWPCCARSAFGSAGVWDRDWPGSRGARP